MGSQPHWHARPGPRGGSGIRKERGNKLKWRKKNHLHRRRCTPTESWNWAGYFQWISQPTHSHANSQPIGAYVLFKIKFRLFSDFWTVIFRRVSFIRICFQDPYAFSTFFFLFGNFYCDDEHIQTAFIENFFTRFRNWFSLSCYQIKNPRGNN